MIRPNRLAGSATLRMPLNAYVSVTLMSAAFSTCRGRQSWIALLDRVGERPEQRGRGQHGGRDRDALGDGLRGVADGVELGEDLRALLVDVAGHLRDALGVVADRAEGVHGDDDADRGEQATAGQRHREQRDDDRAAAEQERTEHGRADGERGVDGRLEADREAGQDDGGRAGERGLADVLDRTGRRCR